MSVKATFTKDFDYRTDRGAIVAYQAGWSGSIPQSHFDAAFEVGVLEGGKPAGSKAEGGKGDGA